MEAWRSSFDHTTTIYRHSTQGVIQSHSTSDTTGIGEFYRSNMKMTTMIHQDGLSGMVKQWRRQHLPEEKGNVTSMNRSRRGPMHDVSNSPQKPKELFIGKQNDGNNLTKKWLLSKDVDNFMSKSKQRSIDQWIDRSINHSKWQQSSKQGFYDLFYQTMNDNNKNNNH